MFKTFTIRWDIRSRGRAWVHCGWITAGGTRTTTQVGRGEFDSRDAAASIMEFVEGRTDRNANRYVILEVQTERSV